MNSPRSCLLGQQSMILSNTATALLLMIHSDARLICVRLPSWSAILDVFCIHMDWWPIIKLSKVVLQVELWASLNPLLEFSRSPSGHSMAAASQGWAAVLSLSSFEYQYTLYCFAWLWWCQMLQHHIMPPPMRTPHQDPTPHIACLWSLFSLVCAALHPVDVSSSYAIQRLEACKGQECTSRGLIHCTATPRRDYTRATRTLAKLFEACRYLSI